jgi:GTPase SAR1 family protein
MRDEVMADGNGFVIVYSITEPSSFDEVPILYESVQRVKDSSESGIPCVLVGNKIDLESERAVLPEQGEEQASQMGKFCTFIETSAKDSINVREIFEEIVKLINKKEGRVLAPTEDSDQQSKKSEPPQQSPTNSSQQTNTTTTSTTTTTTNVATEKQEPVKQSSKKKKKKQCHIL